MKANVDIWDHLVAFARRARLARARDGSIAGNDDAPFGFATRVAAKARELQQAERRLALWQRLAWRSAFASLLLCGAVFLSQRAGGTGEDVLLTPPAIDWPVP